MKNEVIIDVNKRDLGNKNSRKNMRMNKQIPGIYYSHDSKESIPFFMLESEFKKAKSSGAQIFAINVGSKKRNVLFKSIQYHPVTDQVMHVDLYGIKMDQVVSVNVSINLIGEAKGVSMDGGILVQGLNEIEIDCLPIDIPDVIDVDVSELALGDSFRVENLDLDEKLIIKTDENQVLASVTHAMKEEEAPVATEETEEGAEEGDSTSEESPDTEESGSSDNEDKKED